MIEQLQPRGGTEKVFRITVAIMLMLQSQPIRAQAESARDVSCETCGKSKTGETRKSSRFSELRTNLELQIAPVALFPPVSHPRLQSGMDKFERSVDNPTSALEGRDVYDKTQLRWPSPALFMNTSAAIADSLLRRAFGWQARRSTPRRTVQVRLGISRLRMPVSQRDCAISQRTVMNNAGLLIGAIALCFSAGGCKPDDSPFKAENESLRKQLAKHESVVTSLQDGNKVMQQQIDLLNQELRDAKKSAESAKADAKAATDNLAIQAAQTKKLSADVQKTAAAQAAQSIHVEEKGTQTEDIPRPLSSIAKIAEDALSRNGYHIKVSIKTNQKAVYVTERKISPPASLEVAGSRNQYVLSIHALPSNVTRLSVKADFEKLAQGGRVLSVSAEEVAEIERSLIREINKALASLSKT
jgi:hypothetical protein